MKISDIQGNYDFKLVVGDSEPMSNLCSVCGKCVECEHPYWTCPKLEKLSNPGTE